MLQCYKKMQAWWYADWKSDTADINFEKFVVMC